MPPNINQSGKALLNSRASKERKAFLVFIGLGLTVIVCFFPQTLFWIVVMYNDSAYNDVVDIATAFLWSLTTVVHPVVYQLFNSDVRQIIVSMLWKPKATKKLSESRPAAAAP